MSMRLGAAFQSPMYKFGFLVEKGREPQTRCKVRNILPTKAVRTVHPDLDEEIDYVAQDNLGVRDERMVPVNHPLFFRETPEDRDWRLFDAATGKSEDTEEEQYPCYDFNPSDDDPEFPGGNEEYLAMAQGGVERKSVSISSNQRDKRESRNCTRRANGQDLRKEVSCDGEAQMTPHIKSICHHSHGLHGKKKVKPSRITIRGARVMTDVYVFDFFGHLHYSFGSLVAELRQAR